MILLYNKMRNNSTCNKIERPGTDRIGRHEVLSPINHNYKKYVVFELLLIKTQGIEKAFFFTGAEKKSYQRACDGAYCPITYLLAHDAYCHITLSSVLKSRQLIANQI